MPIIITKTSHCKAVVHDIYQCVIHVQLYLSDNYFLKEILKHRFFLNFLRKFKRQINSTTLMI